MTPFDVSAAQCWRSPTLELHVTTGTGRAGVTELCSGPSASTDAGPAAVASTDGWGAGTATTSDGSPSSATVHCDARQNATTATPTIAWMLIDRWFLARSIEDLRVPTPSVPVRNNRKRAASYDGAIHK